MRLLLAPVLLSLIGTIGACRTIPGLACRAPAAPSHSAPFAAAPQPAPSVAGEQAGASSPKAPPACPGGKCRVSPPAALPGSQLPPLGPDGIPEGFTAPDVAERRHPDLSTIYDTPILIQPASPPPSRQLASAPKAEPRSGGGVAWLAALAVVLVVGGALAVSRKRTQAKKG